MQTLMGKVRYLFSNAMMGFNKISQNAFDSRKIMHECKPFLQQLVGRIQSWIAKDLSFARKFATFRIA